MEAFISRKKRKLSPERTIPPSTKEEINALSVLDDDDSTDFKLALLSSLHPYIEQQVLLDLLLAHEGSVENASTSLKNPEASPKKSAATGYQSSLSGFIAPNDSGGPENPAKRSKLLSKKGKTQHLYSPEDVAAHTPCSIIHNFLPAEVANALLVELLEEALTFERMTFKLFDNVVQSPHTACFYVEGSEEQNIQKTEYIYNGGKLDDVRQLTPQLKRVSPIVQEAVNREIETRIKTHNDGKKLKHQAAGPWRPNAAFVNCYNGGAESVGYHSDQLTYLGPRAIIGSISLGVAREFRVRRIVPQDADAKTKPKESSDAEGQIAIHLPHNSLLVMHAEMQEEWKHSIAPAQAIDPHPISGKKRINITYRDYKESLHPKYTPRCKCNVPTVLRVVQRKKENWGKYFWMCYAGNVPGKDGCTFFEWAEFDDDGNPIWKGKKEIQWETTIPSWVSLQARRSNKSRNPIESSPRNVTPTRTQTKIQLLRFSNSAALGRIWEILRRNKYKRERGVRNVTAARKDTEASRAREESSRRKREGEDLEAHRARAAKEKEEWAARHMKKNPEVQAKKAASRKREVPEEQRQPTNHTKSSQEAQEESRRNDLFRLGLTEKQVNRRMKQERHRKVEEEVPEDTLWGKPKEDAQVYEETQITPFRLFDLPPEIVDIIYSYILPRAPNKKRSHAFLRAVSINDKLHQAAMMVFYQINTFEFQVTQGGPLCKTRKEVLEAMIRIAFDISSSAIPITNVSSNITLALNIKHLTLRASAELGLNIIISRYVFKFKKLKTLTVYQKRKPGIANQFYSLFQPKDISQNSIKQNWIRELNYMLGERGVRQDDGTWVWTTKRDCFEMKRKSRHIKFE